MSDADVEMMAPTSTATATTAVSSGQAGARDSASACAAIVIPPSLQQLVRNMEASNNKNVSTNLARKAKFLIEAAIDGSLCEAKLGRRIPLAEALQRCGGELLSAVNEFSRQTSSALQVLTMFGGDFNPATSKKVMSQKLVENFIALDFTGFGIAEYEDVQMALIKFDGGPTSDDVYVINEFCEQIGKLLYMVSKKIGRDIAKDGTITPPAAATTTTAATTSNVAVAATRTVVVPGTQLLQAVTAGVPPSLQQLVRKMEASNDPSVSNDLVRYANALFDAAFSGSMCEKQIGRNITLPEALQRCGLVLLKTFEAFRYEIDRIKRVTMGFGMYDTPVTSKIVVPLESVEKFVSLDFAGFGIAESKDITESTMALRNTKVPLPESMKGLREEGDALKDEIFVVNHFCERFSKLLESVKEKIGHDISATAQAGAAIPPSLQNLVINMKASNDPNVSTDLVKFANTLFEAAFNGSSKRIPLAEALQRCGGELISAVDKYNNEVFHTDMAYRVRQEDVEALIALDFTGFGILEYNIILLALSKVKEGPHKIEISVVKQFCERMSKLL